MTDFDEETRQMVPDQPDETERVHVFDQTNGVVDLGADDGSQVDGDDGMTDADRRRVVGGIAMLSANRPNG